MVNVTHKFGHSGERITAEPQQETSSPARGMAWRGLGPWSVPTVKSLRALEGSAGTFSPCFDVRETQHGYYFTADVPGVPEQALTVICESENLVITGSRDVEGEDVTDVYYSCQRTFGPFARAFLLPHSCDTSQLRADLKQGVLTVFIPKKTQPPEEDAGGTPSEK